MTRRLPLGATLLTLVMIPVLLGLGIWQLQRREWKHGLIARLEAAKTLPAVGPRDYWRAVNGEESLQYRRAEIDCRPGEVPPYDVKGGTSADDQGGFLILVNCNSVPENGPDLVVVAGWTLRPDTVKRIDLDTHFAGTLIEQPYGTEAGRPRFMLIPTTAAPGLLPSRVPVPDDLPDNHLSYALQWFAFAATLAVIYAIYVRQWRARMNDEAN